MKIWFMDTGFVIALSAPRDKFHAKALQLAAEIERSRISLVTTHAVLLEIGAALSKVAFRADAARLIQSLMSDATVEIVPSDANLMQAALKLFEDYSDKEWSLCDCTSFVVMKKLQLSSSLSTDHHFGQAGFDALLLHDIVIH